MRKGEKVEEMGNQTHEIIVHIVNKGLFIWILVVSLEAMVGDDKEGKERPLMRSYI